MPLNEEQWDFFLKELREGNCCLIIGPDIKCLRDAKGELISVLSAFSAFLRNKLETADVGNDPEADFYHHANHYRTVKYNDNVLHFHEDIEAFIQRELQQIPLIYKQLGRLPFRSVCSLMPDNFLADAIRNFGFYFRDEMYDYSVTFREKPELEDEHVLLYYLYGRFGDPNSVAITHREHLELVKKIVAGNPGVPDNIVKRFNNKNKSYLFLGFDFNDWHFRLTIDAIGIPKPNISYFPKSPEVSITFVSENYYTGNHGIQFLHISTEQFVEDLLRRYETRYGAADREITIFIEFAEEDRRYFETFLRQLSQGCSGRNFVYLHKDECLGGFIYNAENSFTQAEVYIPLISPAFWEIPGTVDRARQANADSDKQLIIINTDFTDYKLFVPQLGNRSTILPSARSFLSQLLRLNEICMKIANTINSVIR